ncbi:hypothetical protein AVEN_96248-1 [Araneus ventricosus]|uniref:Uncharacterized protein n=1 Tax=Araneus ventricosus TaxID=182803 RepID=A0A4Y2MA31_ARAVE|nr:hypothetical protein AVEN_96248-1 [Araneus ventricosus]
MDLNPPVSQNSYEKNCKKNAASKNVAIESMKKAADEEVAAVDSTDITVSCDGTWKTRGHTFQIGVCTSNRHRHWKGHRCGGSVESLERS